MPFYDWRTKRASVIAEEAYKDKFFGAMREKRLLGLLNALFFPQRQFQTNTLHPHKST
jgi:hypothetical protein